MHAERPIMASVISVPELFLDPAIADRALRVREGRKPKRRKRPTVDLPGVMINSPPALNCQATTGKPDFKSRPDAKAMTKADIANVERLSRDDAKELLYAIRIVAPEAIAKAIASLGEVWGQGWAEDDERWGMTPHQLRRAKELATQL